jgi:hypothetical protein
MRKYARREKRALEAPKPMVSFKLLSTGLLVLWKPWLSKNTVAKKARMLVEVGILAKT